MTTMNTPDDLIRLLRNDPGFRRTVRREVLTEELLGVPSRLSRVERSIEALLESNATLQKSTAALQESTAAINRRLDMVEKEIKQVGPERRQAGPDDQGADSGAIQLPRELCSGCRD